MPRRPAPECSGPGHQPPRRPAGCLLPGLPGETGDCRVRRLAWRPGRPISWWSSAPRPAPATSVSEVTTRRGEIRRSPPRCATSDRRADRCGRDGLPAHGDGGGEGAYRTCARVRACVYPPQAGEKKTRGPGSSSPRFACRGSRRPLAARAAPGRSRSGTGRRTWGRASSATAANSGRRGGDEGARPAVTTL